MTPFPRATALLVALGAVVAGCRDSTGPNPPSYVRVEPEWVAGDAADAVDPATGLFRLSIDRYTHVSPAKAESVAVAVVHWLVSPTTFGNVLDVAQKDRGGPIDWTRLQPCARAVHVESGLGEFPPETPPSLFRHFGDRWAIAMCGRDGGAHLSIGVADSPLDLRVENGEIVPGTLGGSEFTTTGVPMRYPFGLPLTPEQAVAAVALRTGRRVVRVPTAYNQWDRGIGHLPLCSSWQVEIDQPIEVRSEGTDERRDVHELFVRNAPACFSDSVVFYAAAEIQPSSRWIHFPVRDGDTKLIDSVQVSTTGPMVFERVLPEP